MPTKTLFALGGLFFAACASAGGPEATPRSEPQTPEAPAAAAPEDPSGAATFTEAQADGGRDIFRARCTECHYSSEFSDSQFKFKWSRRTAGNLYELIQTSMPETDPGSLSPEETVALVSYILQMNGFEPGDTELAPNRAVLDAISLASIRGE